MLVLVCIVVVVGTISKVQLTINTTTTALSMTKMTTTMEEETCRCENSDEKKEEAVGQSVAIGVGR